MKAYDVLVDGGLLCPRCVVNHLDDVPQYKRCLEDAPPEFVETLKNQNLEETVELMMDNITQLVEYFEREFPGGLDYEVTALPNTLGAEFKLVETDDKDHCSICQWEGRGIAEMILHDYFPKELLEGAREKNQIELCNMHYVSFRGFQEDIGHGKNEDEEEVPRDAPSQIASLREALDVDTDGEGHDYKEDITDRIEKVILRQDELLKERERIDAELYEIKVKILDFRTEFTQMQRMRAKSRRGENKEGKT